MEAVGGLAVLIMLVLISIFARRIRSGHEVYLRRIPALDRIPHWMSQAVESWRKIHVSLGTGGSPALQPPRLWPGWPGWTTWRNRDVVVVHHHW